MLLTTTRGSILALPLPQGTQLALRHLATGLLQAGVTRAPTIQVGPALRRTDTACPGGQAPGGTGPAQGGTGSWGRGRTQTRSPGSPSLSSCPSLCLSVLTPPCSHPLPSCFPQGHKGIMGPLGPPGPKGEKVGAQAWEAAAPSHPGRQEPARGHCGQADGSAHPAASQEPLDPR